MQNVMQIKRRLQKIFPLILKMWQNRDIHNNL